MISGQNGPNGGPSMQMRSSMQVMPGVMGSMAVPGPMTPAEMFHQVKMTMTPNAYYEGKKFFMNQPSNMLARPQLEYLEFIYKHQQMIQTLKNAAASTQLFF
jgi:hypothetical protein